MGAKTGLIENGDVTDDTRPEFKGWGEAGNTVIIYNGGKEIGRATVGDDGTWSWTPDFNLADGNHSITYTQTDKAGNVSEPSDSRDFIVDTAGVNSPGSITIMDNTGAITGPIQSGDKTDETKPEFSGKGTPGGIITIYDEGKVIGSVVVGEDGNWSLIPDVALEEGGHSITTTETSKSGNESGPSAPVDFVVDTTPPSKPSIDSVIDDQGSITGSILNGGQTDDTTPTFSGEGEPGNIITVTDGGKVISSTVIDENGAWTFTPETPLEDGAHSIVVTETDKAGNTSDPSDSFEFVVDTTPPDIKDLNITGVEDNFGEVTGNITSGSTTDDSRPTIHGTGTADDTIIVYAQDATGNHIIGSTTVGADGKWSLQPTTPLLPGENIFTAVEVDPVGNATKPSDTYTVTLDPSRPTEPVIVNVLDNVGDITGALQKGDVTDDAKPTITGTYEAGYLVRIYDGVTLIGSVTANDKGVWTFTHEVGHTTVEADGTWNLQSTLLMDGSNQLTAVEVNSLGDISAPSAPYTAVLDTDVAPTYKVGSLNDDIFLYAGPGDQVIAGAGNDIINLLPAKSGYISGGEGIDTLVVGGHNNLLNLGALEEKLSSVEIFDLKDGGHNTMIVHLEDVLRLGSEELSIAGNNKAIVVNGDDSSTLHFEMRSAQTWDGNEGNPIGKADQPWVMSQNEHQYAGNTYNVWTNSASNVEVLVENTVHVMM